MERGLTGATIVPMTGETVIENGAILIDDGEIQKIRNEPLDESSTTG